jgi:amidohydrolase
MKMIINELENAARLIQEDVIRWRRDLHQHPELSFQELRTGGIVARTLTELGLEVQTGVGRTGVIGLLEGAHDGPTVLIRADMDALPIAEATGLDYASGVPNVMHACGHDGHTAIALGVARVMAAKREQLHGRIKFVFQPAEEIGEGARAMIADGALDNPRPDVTLGLHLWNNLPVGTLGVADGPVMAGSSIFTIEIAGKGGHAAAPHMSIDPVVCAAHLITALQTIISRTIDPLETGVISVTTVQAGNTHNVIPETARLTGTMRYFSPEIRAVMEERMHEIVTHTCASFRCTGTLQIEHLTPPVKNDPQVAERLRTVFARVEGVKTLDTTVRTMGSEDVSLFMSDIPGMYFFVGARDMTADDYYGHHHPKFTFDEDALPLSVALLSSAAGAYVLGNE